MSSRGEFIKLQIGSFISQCGSHFLTLALSAIVFAHSGSLIRASIVFVLSYLPSVFFSSRLGNWIDRNLSKRVLIGNECLAILASFLCGLSLQLSTVAFCGALALRSVFLFSSRTLSTKWLKIISPPETQGARIKLSFLIFFLATAVSGLLASKVLGVGSIWIIIAVDILTYVFGAGVLFSLKRLPVVISASKGSIPKVSLLTSLKAIAEERRLREAFISVVFSQAIFQGAYSVLVNYLPIHHFKLGVSGTGVFQLAASIGIIAGFCLVWKRQGRRPDSDLGSYFWYAGILALLATTCLPLAGSFTSFLLLNFFYETVWLDATASFFEKSSAQRLAEFQFTLNSVAALGMGLATFAYAVAIQIFGTEAISYMALISFVAIGSWHVVARDRNLSEVGGIGR